MADTLPSTAYSKDQHDTQVDSYKQYENLPLAILEHQLHEAALGDCKGLTVLDLGGGQGLRARQIIDHGAAAVDVVDLSPEMMRIGRQIETTLGRGGDDPVIRWFEGDASQPSALARLPLRFKADGYDLVMANWTFDHCSGDDVLDGMLRSATGFLRPGGRFVGTRVFNTPRAAAISTAGGRLGGQYKDFVDVPGGMRYRYALHVDPLVEYDAASREETYDPAKMVGFHEKYGLVDTDVVPWENASCVKSDPEFWKSFMDLPCMAVVTARKKVE